MKKKIILSLILMCVGIISLGVLNAAANRYGDLTYTVSDNTIKITDCDKSAADVVIPSEFDGKAVTSIGDYAFRGCSGLTSITIPDSVTSIGASAFNGCTGLTSITIPDSVTSIGASAFNGCTGLTSITIGNGVTRIGDDAFRGCTSLTNITIPDSVTRIGWRAFYGCSSLTSVTIPDSVTSIAYYAFSETQFYNNEANWENGVLYCGKYLLSAKTSITKCNIEEDTKLIADAAFSGCTGLTSITIPDSVTSIGFDAFRGCSNLARITIGKGVTSIDGSAFEGCNSLTSITIPDSVTNIGSYAFRGCSNLARITIGKGVTSSIRSSMFEGCTNLANVTIGKGATSIGREAFENCENLAKVTIPDSVTSIGTWAFAGCNNLNRVDITDIAAWCKISFGDVTSNPLYYAHNLYLNGKLVENLVIPDSVTSIGTLAFSGCTGLASVTIPDSVTSIGRSAFYGCSSLNRVNITDIAAWCKIDFGSNPLAYANNLYLNGELVENLIIPDGVESIGNSAFHGCSSLKSITIPDNVTSIGGSAFEDCTSLTSVTIPDSVTSIGWGAFEGCTGLTSITIPDGVTYISSEAFLDCTSLASVTIPDSVTSIGDDAFRGCTGLTSVTIPDSVTSIGDDAFSGCKNLNRVNITDIAAWYKITFGNDYSNPFSYADNLYLNGELVENLVISDSVTSAFKGCKSLTSITFPDGLNIIPESAFSNCSNLKAITIPASMEYIRKDAFSGCDNIKYVFFKGSRDFWDNEMLIYTGNDALKNAEIICGAEEKTYNFVTNCEKTLSPVTAYYIAVKPKTDTLSRKKYVTGWYDNPELSGEPVEFPYYSDKTTLYAKLADRTGESFESAAYVEENKRSTIRTNTDNKYWTFIPEKTGTYVFESNAGSDLYLYNSSKTELISGSNSITFSLAAGEAYYIKGYNQSSDVPLTVTQADYKGTSTAISNNDKKIRILPNKIETGTKITVALYNGDKFVGTKVATYRGGAIEFTTNTKYTSIKVMAWDADNLTPCAKAEVVER